MDTKPKSPASSKPARANPKYGRVSASGIFVVARQDVKSDRFTEAQLREAVRKVMAARGAPRS